MAVSFSKKFPTAGHCFPSLPTFLELELIHTHMTQKYFPHNTRNPIECTAAPQYSGHGPLGRTGVQWVVNGVTVLLSAEELAS